MAAAGCGGGALSSLALAYASSSDSSSSSSSEVEEEKSEAQEKSSSEIDAEALIAEAERVVTDGSVRLGMASLPGEVESQSGMGIEGRYLSFVYASVQPSTSTQSCQLLRQFVDRACEQFKQRYGGRLEALPWPDGGTSEGVKALGLHVSLSRSTGISRAQIQPLVDELRRRVRRRRRGASPDCTFAVSPSNALALPSSDGRSVFLSLPITSQASGNLAPLAAAVDGVVSLLGLPRYGGGEDHAEPIYHVSVARYVLTSSDTVEGALHKVSRASLDVAHAIASASVRFVVRRVRLQVGCHVHVIS